MSTAVYIALAAMPNQIKGSSNETWFATFIWGFENQLNAGHIGRHDI